MTDIGITRSVFTPAQRLAAISEWIFNAYIRDAIGQREEISTRALFGVAERQTSSERNRHRIQGFAVADLVSFAAAGYRAGTVLVHPRWPVHRRCFHMKRGGTTLIGSPIKVCRRGWQYLGARIPKSPDVICALLERAILSRHGSSYLQDRPDRGGLHGGMKSRRPTCAIWWAPVSRNFLLYSDRNGGAYAPTVTLAPEKAHQIEYFHAIRIMAAI